jgi:hypothetical protein
MPLTTTQLNRQIAVRKREMVDICTIQYESSPGTWLTFVTDVPCRFTALPARTVVTSDDSGNTSETVVQRWTVTVPGDCPMPTTAARFVRDSDSKTLETITRVASGDTQQVVIQLEATEVF